MQKNSLQRDYFRTLKLMHEIPSRSDNDFLGSSARQNKMVASFISKYNFKYLLIFFSTVFRGATINPFHSYLANTALSLYSYLERPAHIFVHLSLQNFLSILYFFMILSLFNYLLHLSIYSSVTLTLFLTLFST